MTNKHGSDNPPISKDKLNGIVYELRGFIQKNITTKYQLAELLLKKMEKDNYQGIIHNLFKALELTEDEGYFDIYEKFSQTISITESRESFEVYLTKIPSDYFFASNKDVFTKILKRDVAETVSMLGKQYTIEEYMELSSAVLSITRAIKYLDKNSKIIEVLGTTYTIDEYLDLQESVFYTNETMMTFSQRREIYHSLAQGSGLTITQFYNHLFSME